MLLCRTSFVKKGVKELMELTVKYVWNVLKKSALFMVIGAFLLSAFFWVYTAVSVQKVYQSSA